MSEKLKKKQILLIAPLRKLRFCKWASPKIQQIIKQAGPSSQLFETINFAFMKIFDSLIKTALFWTFLLFFGDLRHKSRLKIEFGDESLSAVFGL